MIGTDEERERERERERKEEKESGKSILLARLNNDDDGWLNRPKLSPNVNPYKIIILLQIGQEIVLFS